jgi:hypothetical protein
LSGSQLGSLTIERRRGCIRRIISKNNMDLAGSDGGVGAQA